MTTCNCKYWSPRDDESPGGRCAIGHLGETVSYRTCERACDKYSGPEPRLVDPPSPVSFESSPSETPEQVAERELLDAALDPNGFGDYAAAAIKLLGIDRLNAKVRESAGLPSSCAACNERRKRWNAVGKWLSAKMSGK